MKVGIQLPEVEREVRWPELRQMVRLIEEAGFDSIWVGDHLLYRSESKAAAGPWEAWSQLAAIAAITERVELGPLVAATPFHSPAMLAKKAVTVDEISAGRLILGLGAGWNQAEFSAFGFPFDNRVSRFEEAFTIIRTLVREGAIDFQGRYYSARDCEILPRGPRPQGPPIMIGSRGPRMLRISAPFMDQWNAWYAWFGNDVARLPPIIEKLDNALLAAGRDPAEVERSAAMLIQLGGGEGRVTGDPDQGVSMPFQGTPHQIAAEIAIYGELGISHMQLVLEPITARSIEAVAEILPLL
ncbi:MAG: LLM class flavin-dependent oxidoreductase [Acidimicrobiia bacterium]